ncbi:MFS transporter [Sphingomonas sp. BIUV-7]|uniref:MFS transporter n=1 Tax=Sphingomonas natans TaxID=3063330 RepID=A0ABT8YED2_9SPHN|nr:MFS transporter [Sphingomonas sp. BIUV-7]MDO6416709.1 MFS transporter [Sphingomonas sp. BIUV-7]
MNATEDPHEAADLPIGKLQRRLMPFLLLMYVLAFLDRTNVGFARDAFQHDTAIGDAAYAFGASIFFLGYAAFEIPSNIILHRVGARLWMARIMITWGLVTAAMMFIRSEGLFYALRLLLGICEAGFFPGVIYFITRWYPPAARSRAIGLFYFGAPITFILGGPLSGLLLDMEAVAGLHGWQWLFVATGLAATAVGIAAFFYLDDRPEDAAWLSAGEKAALARALASAPGDGHDARPRAVLAQLSSPRFLHLGLIYLLIQMSVYGVVFFLPSQVGALIGRSVGFQVGVVSAIPWGCALFATFYLPRLADRTGRRREIAAGALAVAGVGIAVSVAAGSAWLGLLGLCFAASGFIAAQPIFWGHASAGLSGVTAAAGIALINSLGAIGSFLAPNARVMAETLTGEKAAGLLLLAALTLLGAILMLAARVGTERSRPKM